MYDFMYDFTQTFLFLHRFLLFLRRKTQNKSKPEAATLRVCHCTMDAMFASWRMLRFDVCLMCERKSWPTFWSWPTHVGQQKFVV